MRTSSEDVCRGRGRLHRGRLKMRSQIYINWVRPVKIYVPPYNFLVSSIFLLKQRPYYAKHKEVM